MPLTSQTASETSRFEQAATARVLMNLTKVYFHQGSATRFNSSIKANTALEDRDLRAFFIEQNSNVQHER